MIGSGANIVDQDSKKYKNLAAVTRQLRRSKTFSSITFHKKESVYSPIPKLLEKTEIVQEENKNDEKLDDEQREKSILKLRSILKGRLKTNSAVRTIKFSMENKDKFFDDEENDSERKAQKQLLSPPPKEWTPTINKKGTAKQI